MKPVGQHLIADLWGCDGLADPARIEQALRLAVTAAGARLLDLKLHHFGPQQGVTGVALLAESHISIHTWPEHGYAAVDIFLCGDDPRLAPALDCLVQQFQARSVQHTLIGRGLAETNRAGIRAGPQERSD
jgi:S-adenosylmethionine decarboxylase